MSCSCFIIPSDVLHRLSEDKDIPEEARKAAAVSAKISQQIREVRTQASLLTSLTMESAGVAVELAAAPTVTVYDCAHSQNLPGKPVTHPQSSKDKTAVRTFEQTTKVAEFYKTVFHRNSIDNAGMTMMSSIHYGKNYNNAMWNGSQMIYGDGDGQLFVDFTNGNDVIGHELTHGVTQHSLQLNYSGDAGGLNESLSDCFGSMFRQWEKSQDVNAADWLIGADILGPAAKQKGYTALRNMAHPADTHVLAPQPEKYSQITPGMDPHFSSGPPNLAFYTACKTLGGKSWEQIGHVWYRSLTGFGPSPNMKMKAFANRTRQVAHQLYSSTAAVGAAVDAGWQHVGL